MPSAETTIRLRHGRSGPGQEHLPFEPADLDACGLGAESIPESGSMRVNPAPRSRVQLEASTGARQRRRSDASAPLFIEDDSEGGALEEDVLAEDTLARRAVPIAKRPHPDGEGGPVQARDTSFVLDANNELAFRAVAALAAAPGALCRLLFLYGRRGTGKSHLVSLFQRRMRSVGRRIEYLSAERLTYLFSTAVAERQVPRLWDELCRGDILVLEEVHRLGQRRATRALLDQLIHHYLDRSKVVLLTSRHHPRSIYGLGERQISLYMSGFLVLIEPPGPSAKERWLRRRHRLLTAQEPPRELHRMAQVIRGGIGDLIDAHQRFLMGAGIEEIAGQLGRDLESISRATAGIFGIEPDLLCSRDTSRTVVRARDVACFIALRLGFRAGIVGRHYGGRRAQTIRAARQRVLRRIECDRDFAQEVERLVLELTS